MPMYIIFKVINYTNVVFRLMAPILVRYVINGGTRFHDFGGLAASYLLNITFTAHGFERTSMFLHTIYIFYLTI